MIFISIIFLCFTSFYTKSYQQSMVDSLDYASSPIDFKNLVITESSIVVQLLKILKDCDSKLSCPLNHVLLKRYLEDFSITLLNDVGIKLHHFKGISNGYHTDMHAVEYDAAKNPLKIYRTLKRLVHLLPGLINSTLTNTSEIYEIHKLTASHSLLNNTDSNLKTSILNILRLQQIFKLPFSEFLKGNVGSIKSSCRLYLADLVEFGKVAFSDESYAQAVDAYATVVEYGRMKLDKSNTPVNQGEVANLLNEAIKQHDNKLHTIKATSLAYDDIHVDSGLLLFNTELYNTTHSNFHHRIPIKLETIFPIPISDEDVCGSIKYEAIQNGYIFEELCRGEEKKTPAEKSRLKCYFSSKSHPEFILKPIELEVHNVDPLLIQYHNIFTEHEMQLYRDEVQGEMRTSKTTPSSRSENKSPRISRQRTSSSAWIEDYSRPPIFKELLHKIGRILNVDTSKETGSEMMQIAAYSPGGHYAPHTDAIFEHRAEERLEPFDLISGDRIMTFMVYLSDVEEGGGTAFPILKTYINAVKGSALMWYNLHPNDGSIDRRTLHGGCSVLYGVKWIANKWIRSHDQFQMRKCPVISSESWPLDMHVNSAN